MVLSLGGEHRLAAAQGTAASSKPGSWGCFYLSREIWKINK